MVFVVCGPHLAHTRLLVLGRAFLGEILLSEGPSGCSEIVGTHSGWIRCRIILCVPFCASDFELNVLGGCSLLWSPGTISGHYRFSSSSIYDKII